MTKGQEWSPTWRQAILQCSWWIISTRWNCLQKRQMCSFQIPQTSSPIQNPQITPWRGRMVQTHKRKCLPARNEHSCEELCQPVWNLPNLWDLPGGDTPPTWDTWQAVVQGCCWLVWDKQPTLPRDRRLLQQLLGIRQVGVQHLKLLSTN